jgi:hypothetical protein
MSRCYAWRAVSKYDECVRRPRRSRACRAGQGCRRCGRVQAGCRGTGAKRAVRRANVCRGDMRRHICRLIYTCFVSGRVTRTERMPYTTCDWNGLRRRNREPPSPTIRRIDFLPIGNDIVHMSRRAIRRPMSCRVRRRAASSRVTHFPLDTHTRSCTPTTLLSTSAHARRALPECVPQQHAATHFPPDTHTRTQTAHAPVHKRPRSACTAWTRSLTTCGDTFPAEHTCAQSQTGHAPVHKGPRPACAA